MRDQANADAKDAIENARAWIENITSLYHAYRKLSRGEAEEVEVEGNRFDSEEELLEYCTELPLGVSVRGTWHAPGDTETAIVPVAYQVLLTTGGPGLRLIGDLDSDRIPVSVRVEYCDWGVPWTEWTGYADEEALLWFVELFWWAGE